MKKSTKFYADDEQLAAIATLMEHKTIIEYLRENPWSDGRKVASALNKPESECGGVLHNMELYKFLKGQLIPVSPGYIVRYYALAEDFDQRKEELEEIVHISNFTYIKRHYS